MNKLKNFLKRLINRIWGMTEKQEVYATEKLERIYGVENNGNSQH